MTRLHKNILNIVLFFFVMTLSSCSTFVDKYKQRNTHRRELWAIVGKYSDVLDLKRSSIDVSGAGYYFFNSSEPCIGLSLYLNPDTYNREAVIAIRDEFAAFFRNNTWESRRRLSYHENIVIKFLLTENNETLTFYDVKYRKKSQFSVWQSYGISKECLAGFEDFLGGEISQNYTFRFWDIVQTENNGVGFELWVPAISIERHGEIAVENFFIMNYFNGERFIFFIESYLNSDQFTFFIENHEWIFVDDDFHVTLFFTSPWGTLGDLAKFISYKRTGYSVWEKQK